MSNFGILDVLYTRMGDELFLLISHECRDMKSITFTHRCQRKQTKNPS